MIVCVDTNTLVQGRVPHHRYFPIMDAIVDGRLEWAVSNRVLTEYQEVLTRISGATAWIKMSHLLDLIATSGNLITVSPHFQFRVINDDPDDNAFTDCAIAAHADYVITEDRHFAPLANAGYKPQPITPQEFIARYRGVHV
jgi:putative PIN family toxin of toxin-antitoxin system